MVQPQAIQESAPTDDIRSAMNRTPTGQHLLLGSFVLPFVDSDPTSQTQGIEDGLTKCWVKDGQVRFATFSRTLNKWNRWGEEPVGTIKMYTGDGANLDAGWYLCDGENGTVNLIDQFVLAGTFDSAGATVAGQTTAIANHSDHVFTQPDAHPQTTPTSAASGLLQGNVALTGATTLPQAGHTHVTTIPAVNHANGAVDTHSVHTVSQDYVPPSYTLAFIQKVS